VRAMIAELHSFPVADAHSLLEGALSWAERMRHHRATLTAAVWSRLSADERDALDAAWDAHDATLDDVELCLVHADLFPEHVLVDDATGRPVGMIDFEDASVGDPASDHAGLLHHLDVAPPATLARRAWFAAVKVDLWEIANADDTSVEVHLAALRRRLATGPR